VTDANFLDRLLVEPSDHATRLVYADWLEEQGDDESNAKAQFLRLTAELSGPDAKKRNKSRRHRLQQLAAGLDTGWLAVVSRLDIENCHPKRSAAAREVRASSMPLKFKFQCPREWAALHSTDAPAVRFCDECRQNVHYCDTITEAREHVRAGHCIAI